MLFSSPDVAVSKKDCCLYPLLNQNPIGIFYINIFLWQKSLSVRTDITSMWHLLHQIKSINRLEQVQFQCLTLLSQRDLTVVMETWCESTKEVTDNIDMTNLFFLFLPPVSSSHFLCICGPFVWRACAGYRFAVLPFLLPLPSLSDCTFHAFSPHASPPSLV